MLPTGNTMNVINGNFINDKTLLDELNGIAKRLTSDRFNELQEFLDKINNRFVKHPNPESVQRVYVRLLFIYANTLLQLSNTSFTPLLSFDATNSSIDDLKTHAINHVLKLFNQIRLNAVELVDGDLDVDGIERLIRIAVSFTDEVKDILHPYTPSNVVAITESDQS